MASESDTTQSLTSEAWDSAADIYELFIEPFTGHYAKKAVLLCGGVGPGDKIIEVAAGTGALSEVIARTGADLLATDFSDAMAAQLVTRISPFSKRCQARVMDGQALDAEDGSFDAAFSNFGIMLFPDWQKGLRELARVTKPGGRACVAVWDNPVGAGPALAFSLAYQRAFPERKLPSPSTGSKILSDKSTLKRAMERAGFAKTDVHSVEGEWKAPSLDWVTENADRLYGFLPIYDALAEADRQSFRSALGEILVPYMTIGGIRIPACANIAVGIRGETVS